MLLKIQNLSVDINQKPIVKDINLDIEEQSIVALVGGSGSGKTTTGLSILGLLAPQLRVSSGKIYFEDKDLFALHEDKLREIRGGKISMIFQEPLDAFNPVFTIGYQIDEVLKYHTEIIFEKRKKRVLELLDIAGISDCKRVALNYPHQLSGGMRQRAMIAQAIAANPKLIIADEPTSNLDVTIQARMIELFKRLVAELNLSILLITHDLGVVQYMADKVAVMYEGEIVECGNAQQVLGAPKHPYTSQLMEALQI